MAVSVETPIIKDLPFKVIIVGAGVAGLTLAHPLEKGKFDYVLLAGVEGGEARPKEQGCERNDDSSEGAGGRRCTRRGFLANDLWSARGVLVCALVGFWWRGKARAQWARGDFLRRVWGKQKRRRLRGGIGLAVRLAFQTTCSSLRDTLFV